MSSYHSIMLYYGPEWHRVHAFRYTALHKKVFWPNLCILCLFCPKLYSKASIFLIKKNKLCCTSLRDLTTEGLKEKRRKKPAGIQPMTSRVLLCALPLRYSRCSAWYNKVDPYVFVQFCKSETRGYEPVITKIQDTQMPMSSSFMHQTHGRAIYFITWCGESRAIVELVTVDDHQDIRSF